MEVSGNTLRYSEEKKGKEYIYKLKSKHKSYRIVVEDNIYIRDI